MKLFSEKDMKKDFSFSIWNEFMQTFDHFPVAAILNEDYFAVHGGISPHLKRLNDLQRADRFLVNESSLTKDTGNPKMAPFCRTFYGQTPKKALMDFWFLQEVPESFLAKKSLKSF